MVRKNYSFLLGLGLLLYFICCASGGTVYVDKSYTGSTQSGTESQPYKSIRSAIASATPYADTVRVKAGTYFENVQLRSGVDVVGDGYDTVVIHGGFVGPTVAGSAVSNVLLKGFGITGGTSQTGGGVLLTNSSITIESCRIHDNFTTWGGGVYLTDSTVSVKDSIISSNEARDAPTTYSGGGGIYARRSTLTVEDTYIEDNFCQNLGGGIIVDNNSTADIDRCFIINNVSFDGGGVYWLFSGGSIRRCVVSGNQTTRDGSGVFVDTSSVKITRTRISGNARYPGYGGRGGGVYFYQSSQAGLYNCVIDGNSSWDRGGAIYCENSSTLMTNNTIVSNSGYLSDGGIIAIGTLRPNVRNCILWGNGDDLDGASAQYSQIQDGDSGTGNSAGNPLFADADYALQAGSPCINTGDPSAAYNDPDGSRNDRGAYGGPYAAIAADVDDDGCINIVDLIFVRNKLNADPASDGAEACDINNDGQINIVDLIWVRNKLNEGCSQPQWP